MEEGTEDIIPEDVISDEVRSQAKLKLSDKIEEIKKIGDFRDLSYDKAINFFNEGYLEHVTVTFDLRSLVNEILKDISSAGAKFLNTMMIKSKDAYFIDHAINTTILAILIGSKYRFSKNELSSLALGTLLHDIGKIVIEQIEKEDSQNKTSRLYKEHPTFGYLLLKNSPDITPMESQIVNQHHEFQDGSGFPIGLQGENLPPIKSAKRKLKGYIFRFAEICCVVNALDNLVLNPLEQEKLTPQDALKYMISNAGIYFNKNIVETLSLVVPMYPVGTRVQFISIADPNLLGSYGIVAKINETMLNKPIVIITTNKYGHKIKPIMLDTSKLKGLELKLII